ncbi:RING finger protein 122-like [Oscarella lobularis]|uniref:RING finger protein 122-like n=1 Tax=Oscarella lobularis TaxID=121494 RepID=UPI00331337B9
MDSYALPWMALGGIITVLIFFCCYCMCRIRRAEEDNLQGCRKIKYRPNSKTDVTNEACPICLEDFNANETIYVCSCLHGYHGQCIGHWLSRSIFCPVCKAPVRPPRSERSHLLDI